MIEITSQNNQPAIKVHSDITLSETDLINVLVALTNKTYFNQMLDILENSLTEQQFDMIYNKVLFKQQLPLSIVNNPKGFLEAAKLPYVKLRQGIYDEDNELL